MSDYLVLYRGRWDSPFDAPAGFATQATTTDEAEAQCKASIPLAEVVWVCKDTTYDEALNDYYGNNQKEAT